MTAQTLMFGIGATKAGTSWLHRYIALHPECHLTTIKELHYFDGLEAANPITRKVVPLTRELTRLESNHADEPAAKHAARKLRADDLRRWIDVVAQGDAGLEAYLGFLRARAGQARLIGEITPAYCMLPEARLRQMAGLAGRVRFVYLLRDPLDRLWSHARMTAERSPAPGQSFGATARAVLERLLAGGEPALSTRSDYAGSLRRLTAALRPDTLFTEFYEQFFTEAALRRLCDFLGIGYRAGDLETRVHAGRSIAMPEDLRPALLRFLEPQYAYVKTMFGTLPERWQANMRGV